MGVVLVAEDRPFSQTQQERGAVNPLGSSFCLRSTVPPLFTSQTDAVNSFIRRALISSADAAEHQVQSGLLRGALNREPAADSHSWSVASGPAATVPGAVPGKRSEEEAGAASPGLFTCLHRCRSSFNTPVYNKSAGNMLGKAVEGGLGGFLWR